MYLRKSLYKDNSLTNKIVKMRLFSLLVFLHLLVLPAFGTPISVFFDGNQPLSEWSGDNSSFVFSNGQLRLQALPGGKVAYLSMPSTSMDDAEWRLSLQMDFNPSGSNLFRFYLCSDTHSLRDSLNGYFLQIGNASDQILLYRQTGVSVKKLAAGETLRLNRDSLHLIVRVTRSQSGEWHVYSKMKHESSFLEECSVVDTVWRSSYYCGFYCKYSSTRNKAFAFDSLFVDGKTFLDTESPVVNNIAYSDSLIKITFSEKIDARVFKFKVDDCPLSAKWNSGFSELTLSFLSPLKSGDLYELHLMEMKDMAGNALPDTVWRFGLPEKCMPKDVIINEVLFNPFEDGTDYVELYNRSSKMLDVSNLLLATYRSDGSIYSAKKIGSKFLFPKEYLLLTADKYAVCTFYDCLAEEAFLEMDKLPAYGNEKGCVVLIDKDSLLIDDFCYAASMHDEFLQNRKGVSLERCSPDGNVWRSASAASGFGTPGYGNSMHLTEVDEVSMLAEVCYPYQDESGFLKIKYSFSQDSYVATVNIYNMNGICVRTLADHLRLSSQGTLEWDGCDDNGNVLSVAPYIILFEANDANGHTVSERFVCVVSW